MSVPVKYLFIVLVLLGSNHLFAQNGTNPFELKHRLPEKTAGDASIVPETDSRLIKSNNPFDIAREPIKEVAVVTVTSKSNKKTSAVTKNYLFWTFFILLIFFSTVVTLSRKRLEQSYRAFFNDNYARQLHRANQGSFSLGYSLLYLLFFFNAGIFIFLATNHFGGQLPRSVLTILGLSLAVALAFLLKHLLLYFVENIFPISKEIKLYSFTVMVFSIILGIVLLPLNVFAAFAAEGITNVAIWLGLGAILATYSFRSLRGLSIGSRYIMLHSFHFLLYLCAVEILPVVVLLKFILLRIN